MGIITMNPLEEPPTEPIEALRVVVSLSPKRGLAAFHREVNTQVESGGIRPVVLNFLSR